MVTNLRVAAEIPIRQRTRALFVKGYTHDTTAEQVPCVVAATVPTDQHIRVTKLAGLFQDHYSSFHVEVSTDSFYELMQPGSWTKGVTLRPYRGKLQQYRIYVEPRTEPQQASKRHKMHDETQSAYGTPAAAGCQAESMQTEGAHTASRLP